MINLHNDDMRRGAMDAISALIRAKSGEFRVKNKDDGPQGPEGQTGGAQGPQGDQGPNGGSQGGSQGSQGQQGGSQGSQGGSQGGQQGGSASGQQGGSQSGQQGGSSSQNGQSGGASGSDGPQGTSGSQNSPNQKPAGDNKIGKLKMPKTSNIVDVNQKERDEKSAEGRNPDDPNEKESAADKQARLERIKNSFNDEQKLNKELQDIKTDTQMRINADKQEKEKIKAAKEAEARKWHGNTGLMNFEVFASELKKAMGQQLIASERPEDDFRKYNPTYKGSDLLMPGQGNRELRIPPLINVYFDLSGSLSEEAINNGKQAVFGLSRLKAQHKLNYKLYYFANEISDTPDKSKTGRGTRAFPRILDHVKETRANNVIIFTDDDFDSQTDFASIEPIKVKGCVWWMWAHGEKAPRAKAYLTSRHSSKTFEYYL